jgi:hypothetical protein
MNKPAMTSRERMQAALACQAPDHTPCAFMMYKGLKDHSSDNRAFIQAQMELGLDTVVELPIRPPRVVNDHYNLHGLPVSFDPCVCTREWLETGNTEAEVLIKEYATPGGSLRVEVKKTSDWPWGNHVPFLDDHLVPRSRKYLVERPEDLQALGYLLVPPTPAEVEAYHRDSAPILELAEQHGLHDLHDLPSAGFFARALELDLHLEPRPDGCHLYPAPFWKRKPGLSHR